MAKIQLKRSGVLDGEIAKKPSTDQMDYGELAVNYNAEDPSIFLKTTDDNIVKISGSNSIGNDLQAVTDAGSTTTNGATFGGRVTTPDILVSDGSNNGYFAGDYQQGAFLRLTTTEGKTGEALRITSGGTGADSAVTTLNYDGSATFAGPLEAASIDGGTY